MTPTHIADTVKEREAIEANRARLDYARRRLAEKSDQAWDEQITGGITIFIPLLKGRHGKVKISVDEHQPE